ncbi:aminoacyl-tRNA hydrolase [bacterium]|nr:aminoacyl-tRNA hydrolase [bacterium]
MNFVDKYLIVGLGNPGTMYNNTRHQVGFMVVDFFANQFKLNFSSSSLNGLVAQFSVDNKKVFLCKPTTYMNLSGEFISQMCHYYQIDYKNILVILDDVNIDIGKFRLRQNGTDGGHNGMKNIINMTKTSDIKRLKIGVLNSELLKKMGLKDFVLSKFTPEEMQKINNNLPKISNLIIEFVKLSFDNLMSKYNNN